MTNQEKLDAFIKRAGFSCGWRELESWARRMAKQAVEEIESLQARIAELEAAPVQTVKQEHTPCTCGSSFALGIVHRNNGRPCYVGEPDNNPELAKQEQEPVCYLRDYRHVYHEMDGTAACDDKLEVCFPHEHGEQFPSFPVYVHPPADAQQQEIERLKARIDEQNKVIDFRNTQVDEIVPRLIQPIGASADEMQRVEPSSWGCAYQGQEPFAVWHIDDANEHERKGAVVWPMFDVFNRGNRQIITEENCTSFLTNKLMDCANFLGQFPKVKIDKRAWAHILVYAPAQPVKQEQEPVGYIFDGCAYLKAELDAEVKAVSTPLFLHPPADAQQPTGLIYTCSCDAYQQEIERLKVELDAGGILGGELLKRNREREAQIAEYKADAELLLAALKDMCAEFRGYDLPYGSRAYRQANAAIAKVKEGK